MDQALLNPQNLPNVNNLELYHQNFNGAPVQNNYQYYFYQYKFNKGFDLSEYDPIDTENRLTQEKF